MRARVSRRAGLVKASRALVAALLVLAGTPVLGQEAGAEARAAQPDGGRRLGGHAFIPSLLVRSPFTVTEFQVDLVYGAGNAAGPAYGTGGLLDREVDYTFAVMGQTFAYELNLTEDVSAALGAVTELYSGIDGPSALVVGAEIGAGVFARVTAGHRFGPVRAAVTLDASYAPRFGIKVLDAVLDALEQGVVDEDPALDTSNTWTVRPGVAAAWAPIPALGLTASVDSQWVSLEEDDSGRESAAALDVGLSADLDLSTFTRAPVALIASYRATVPLEADAQGRYSDVSAGVFYTGRPGLMLGFESGHRTFDVQGFDASATLTQIRFQYMW